MTAPASGSASVSGRAKYMALIAALLGWMFDGLEMGLFPLIGRDAINDLMTVDSVRPSEQTVSLWISVITACFLVGAATGGVLFGWLGDRIGRVRAMTLSVFTYAFFTGICGLCNDALQIGILRFIASLGMGGEWSLGVALVMEVWPDRSRAFMAGLIGAAANVGYLLVGIMGYFLTDLIGVIHSKLLSVGFSAETSDWLVAHKGWRILMISGAIPALLTFLIRLCVPESEKWKQEQRAGATTQWSMRDLLVVILGIVGPGLMIYVWATDPANWPAFLDSLIKDEDWLVSGGNVLLIQLAVTAAGLLIAAIGFSFPLVQYLSRLKRTNPELARQNAGTVRRMLLASCLSGVALLGTWASVQQATTWVKGMTQNSPDPIIQKYAGPNVQMTLAVGAIVGTIAGALLGERLGRRPAYCLLCFLSLVSTVALYQNTEYGRVLLGCAFLAGGCTASFYGWLPLYLPEIFQTNVRAIGQGFSFNFGRIIAAVGALQILNLVRLFKEDQEIVPGLFTLNKEFPAACSTLSLIYIVGMLIIWLAPETRGKPLPE